jgi:hypothetical protein
MTRVIQAREDVDVGWLMVELEYQAAVLPKLGDCMWNVLTLLSKFKDL